MDFSRLLTDLLLKNEKVYIPQLGILLFVYKPAEVSEELHKITPPSRILQFIPDERCDDHPLVTAITTSYEIDETIAREEVENFVESIHKKLESGEEIEVPEIGVFRKSGAKIEFEPKTEGILYSDSYGLDVANLPLIDIEEPETEKIEEAVQPVNQTPVQGTVSQYSTPRKKIKWILYAVIGVAAVLILGVLYFSFIWENPYAEIVKKLNKISAINKERVSKDTIENTINDRNNMKNALNYQEPNASSQTDTSKNKIAFKKYYLIAGSFKSYLRALQFKEKVDKSGFNSEVLNLDDTIYRVSLKSFNDRTEALQELAKIRSGKKTNYDVWLLSL